MVVFALIVLLVLMAILGGLVGGLCFRVATLEESLLELEAENSALAIQVGAHNIHFVELNKRLAEHQWN